VTEDSSKTVLNDKSFNDVVAKESVEEVVDETKSPDEVVKQSPPQELLVAAAEESLKCGYNRIT